jgi:hypothetical protein
VAQRNVKTTAKHRQQIYKNNIYIVDARATLLYLGQGHAVRDMHPPVLRPLDQQHRHVGDVLSSGQQVPILQTEMGSDTQKCIG